MNSDFLEDINTWFRNYVKTFYSGNTQSVPMIQLKFEHSFHVGDICRTLSKELHWPDKDIITAEILGILHDVGRFSQFVKYGTFTDSESVNHGEHGYGIINQSNILSSLSSRYRNCILDGILYHNCKNIPHTIRQDSLPFVKLIRDADKLDIYRVFTEFSKTEHFIEHFASTINIDPHYSINQRVLEEIRGGHTVSHENIKSLHDFYMMELSWVFDINYSPTFQRIVDNNIFKPIIQELPDDKEVKTAVDFVLSYLETHVN